MSDSRSRPQLHLPKVLVCQLDKPNTLRIADICYSISVIGVHLYCGVEGKILVSLQGGTLD